MTQVVTASDGTALADPPSLTSFCTCGAPEPGPLCDEPGDETHPALLTDYE